MMFAVGGFVFMDDLCRWLFCFMDDVRRWRYFASDFHAVSYSIIALRIFLEVDDGLIE